MLFVISLIVNIGMWLERFIIVVTSLHRDFSAVVVGNVLPDAVGLGDLCRHDRIFPDPAISIYPVFACDFDLGNARAG